MKRTIAVIYGGRSGEHEISVRSAESIFEAIDPDRYVVRKYRISAEGKWSPEPILPEPGANPGIDVVFPVLHGTFGEDGTVQGLLELADLPYVGAGVLASAASMDKETTKRLCEHVGIPVVEYLAFYRGDIDADAVEQKFAYPVFVKPANLGSSVGISMATNRSELENALRLAAEFDRKIIVERAVVGREFECSVLGNRDAKASQPCEILPSRDFYDYDEKYVLNKTQFGLPADLPPEKTEELRRIAVAAYHTVECEGMARVDFLLEQESGNLYINEINTIPGFTSISMYPKMWAHSGISYSELIDRLIELALERHEAKSRTRYAR
jgi:D-alanine-D-alanine ligase